MRVRNAMNHSGFSLVEVLVGAGITACLSLAIATFVVGISKQGGAVDFQQNMKDFRAEIIQALKDDAAFAVTMSNNAGVFACILNKSSCSRQGGEFIIFDAFGKRVEISSLSSEATRGFGIKTRSCDEYGGGSGGSDGGGSNQCPFKYVATWQAICGDRYELKTKTMQTDGVCLNPTIRINVQFSYKPEDEKQFPIVNVEAMHINVARSQVESDPNVLCGMINGTFISETVDSNSRFGSCVTPLSTSLNCIDYCASLGARTGSGFVTGFDDNGRPICECDLLSSENAVNCGGIAIIDGGNGGIIKSISAGGANVECTDGIVAKLIATGNFDNPMVSRIPVWLGGEELPPATIAVVTVESNDVLWDVNRVRDGSLSSAYSSKLQSSMNNDRHVFLAAWTDHGKGAVPVKEVILNARLDGGPGTNYGFPAEYDLYVTAIDNSAWVKVGNFSNQPDANHQAVIDLGTARPTYGILIVPTKFGTDNYGSYVFQMAEIELKGP